MTQKVTMDVGAAIILIVDNQFTRANGPELAEAKSVVASHAAIVREQYKLAVAQAEQVTVEAVESETLPPEELPPVDRGADVNSETLSHTDVKLPVDAAN